MGNCKNRRLIGPYLDGALGECRWLEEHLNDCAECLSEYETIQRIGYLARRVDMAPPESAYWRNFGNRTLARVMARIPQTKEYRRWTIMSRLPVFLRIFAASSLMIILMVILISPDSGTDVASDLVILQESSSGAVANDTDDNPVPVGANLSADSKVSPEPRSISYVENGGGSDSELEEFRSADFSSIAAVSPKGSWRGNRSPSLPLVDHNLKTVDISGRPNGELPNSELMMRLQVAGNQNTSLIPLHLYHVDKAFYFAADLNKFSAVSSTPRPGSRWGYASGDRNSDPVNLYRYELELRLIENK